ncbi:MAG: hypothetical protein JOZ85_18530, partial [Betaproteobacteria bacterium]|nr:hypothetical protein [Betaproteobacteria bacterium]
MTTEFMTIPPFVTNQLAHAGVNVNEALRKAGAPARPLHGDRLRLDAKQFLAFWAAVEDLGAPKDFGFNLTAQVPP